MVVWGLPACVGVSCGPSFSGFLCAGWILGVGVWVRSVSGSAPVRPAARGPTPLNHGSPQAHVAVQFRVSRPTVATWVARSRAEGVAGRHGRSNRLDRCPDHLAPEIVAEVEALRRELTSMRSSTPAPAPQRTTDVRRWR
ncbi:leucine zipper domain-containing protein [Micrococcus luteus]